MKLNKEESLEFLKQLNHPTDDICNIRNNYFKSMNENISITPVNGGFDCEVKNLNLDEVLNHDN